MIISGSYKKDKNLEAQLKSMKFVQKWCKQRRLNLLHLHITSMVLYLERAFWKNALFAFYMGYRFLLDVCQKMKRVFFRFAPYHVSLDHNDLLETHIIICHWNCIHLLPLHSTSQISLNLIYFNYELFAISTTKSDLRVLKPCMAVD